MEVFNGIKIGDWVTCYFAGYWQVIDIKPSYVNGKMSNTVAILKKGFSSNMKHNCSMAWCDIGWCERVRNDVYAEIVDFFDKNPDKKLSFEQYSKQMQGITKGWLLDLQDEEIVYYNEQLNQLPKYFSIKKFNRFVEEIGLRRHMYKSSSRAKYMMTIVTYPWLVDKINNNSPMYFVEKGIYIIPKKKLK